MYLDFKKLKTKAYVRIAWETLKNISVLNISHFSTADDSDLLLAFICQIDFLFNFLFSKVLL